MKELIRYKIYFRIPFFKYFIGYDKTYKKLILLRKIWDEMLGNYRWKEL